MNPGIGAPELLVLLVLALVVVGPKDLPLMVRRIGQFVGRMRGLARDFRRSFDEMGREAELAELRKEVDALKRANPINEVKREFETAEQDALREPIEDVPHPRLTAKPKPPAKPAEAASEAVDGAAEQKSG